MRTYSLLAIALVFSCVLSGCSLARLASEMPAMLTTVAATAPSTPTPVSPAPTPQARQVATPRVEEAANVLEAQVIAVFELAGPAVVNITSRGYTYDRFMRAVPQEGSGSGFVYDALGHIVTNYHVIANAQSISVALADGQVYAATVVGQDPSTDLAVLRIDAQNLPQALPLANSDRLRVGQFVVAIGNPFGLERTLTVGVISSLGRVIESPDGRFIGEAIQTDAAINPGNSGGPLLDLQGRVIGVNSQIISPSQASAGIGFAVSANTVQRVAPQLIAQGRYPHPWLGVSLLDLNPSLVQVLRQAGANIPRESGLLVIEAIPGGPAATAGIRGAQRSVVVGGYRIPVGGDIIVALGGKPILNQSDLAVYLDTQTRVGDKLDVTVVRDGQERTFTVTLQERPSSS